MLIICFSNHYRHLNFLQNSINKSDSNRAITENKICIENTYDFSDIHTISSDETSAKIKNGCFPFTVSHDSLKGRWANVLFQLLYLFYFPFNTKSSKYLFVQILISFRHLIASREIQPGEIILIDQPYTQGPPTKSLPTCLQCGKLSSNESYRCSR